MSSQCIRPMVFTTGVCNIFSVPMPCNACILSLGLLKRCLLTMNTEHSPIYLLCALFACEVSRYCGQNQQESHCQQPGRGLPQRTPRCEFVCACMHAYVCVCMCVCVYVCVCVCVCVWCEIFLTVLKKFCMCVCVYVCV